MFPFLETLIKNKAITTSNNFFTPFLFCHVNTSHPLSVHYVFGMTL